jgi:hypothetical protein
MARLGLVALSSVVIAMSAGVVGWMAARALSLVV